MSRAKRNPVQSDMAQIRSDIGSLKSDVVSLTRSVGMEAKYSASENISRLKLRGKDTMARVEDTVREQPAKSLLAAFGAGIVLSALTRRG